MGGIPHTRDAGRGALGAGALIDLISEPLLLAAYDKDTFRDDKLGKARLDLRELRDKCADRDEMAREWHGEYEVPLVDHGVEHGHLVVRFAWRPAD